MTSLYQQLAAAGVEIENHYSDMYVPINAVTEPLVKESGKKYGVFMHQIRKELWYDIPLSYEPFWAKVAVRI